MPEDHLKYVHVHLFAYQLQIVFDELQFFSTTPFQSVLVSRALTANLNFSCRLILVPVKFRVLRVSGEDLLSEIEQYDTCSVFECFHCLIRSYFCMLLVLFNPYVRCLIHYTSIRTAYEAMVY